jgi:hypothetical protein
LFWNKFVKKSSGTKYQLVTLFRGGLSRGCGRMASADGYRRYASECVALAGRVLDLADKARLIDMAQAFLDLAGKQHHRKTPSSQPAENAGSPAQGEADRAQN